MTTNKKIKIIGVGGYARSGKDTFVKIASKILSQNGYTSSKLAFADALKKDFESFIKEKYNIDVWTDDNAEKSLIRPLLVAHGCGKRNQTKGNYWIDKVNDQLNELSNNTPDNHIYFLS